MLCRFSLFVVVLFFGRSTFAAFVFEIDIDGLNDDIVTLNEDFEYDGDTAFASQSIPSKAFGMTGGDSIFGGNGSMDTYTYFYAPTAQADNLVVPPGTELGDGEFGSGVVGGGPGTYRVFATWPFSSNISGGLTTYTVSSGAESFTVEIDQNGKGNDWIRLGDIEYAEGDIFVEQTSAMDSFVSMRAAGLLFEIAPEEVACEATLGDFDGNGTVEFSDFLVLSSNFGQPGDGSQGDADCNGQVEFADFLILSENFGMMPRGATSVPEPQLPPAILLLWPLFRRKREDHWSRLTGAQTFVRFGDTWTTN